MFVGTSRGIETRLVPAAGFELHLIEVGGLNRVDLATRLKTVLDLPRAVMASARLIREFRPDVMIGVGGYASGPAMLAAAMMNIPTVAFEPNVVPGFANRMVAPTVRAAAVHFEEDLPLLPQLPGHRRSGAARVLQRAAATEGRAADLAGLRRQPGSARHQPGGARRPCRS